MKSNLCKDFILLEPVSGQPELQPESTPHVGAHDEAHDLIALHRRFPRSANDGRLSGAAVWPGILSSQGLCLIF